MSHLLSIPHLNPETAKLRLSVMRLLSPQAHNNTYLLFIECAYPFERILFLIRRVTRSIIIPLHFPVFFLFLFIYPNFTQPTYVQLPFIKLVSIKQSDIARDLYLYFHVKQDQSLMVLLGERREMSLFVSAGYACGGGVRERERESNNRSNVGAKRHLAILIKPYIYNWIIGYHCYKV